MTAPAADTAEARRFPAPSPWGRSSQGSAAAPRRSPRGLPPGRRAAPARGGPGGDRAGSRDRSRAHGQPPRPRGQPRRPPAPHSRVRLLRARAAPQNHHGRSARPAAPGLRGPAGSGVRGAGRRGAERRRVALGSRRVRSGTTPDTGARRKPELRSRGPFKSPRGALKGAAPRMVALPLPAAGRRCGCAPGRPRGCAPRDICMRPRRRANGKAGRGAAGTEGQWRSGAGPNGAGPMWRANREQGRGSSGPRRPPAGRGAAVRAPSAPRPRRSPSPGRPRLLCGFAAHGLHRVSADAPPHRLRGRYRDRPLAATGDRGLSPCSGLGGTGAVYRPRPLGGLGPS